MNHVNAGLEVTVGGEVLVVCRGGDVVGKWQTVEVVLEVGVEETLIGTVKGDAPLGQANHGVVVAVIGRQGHDTGVEDVGPTDIRGGRKGVWEVEELIGSSVGNDIGVDVDNSGELRLLPQVDLGKGRVQIGTVHEVEVGRLVIADSRHRQDIVVDGLIPAQRGERRTSQQMIRLVCMCVCLYHVGMHINAYASTQWRDKASCFDQHTLS